MSICLLDTNVLVALFDPAHPNHEDAHKWFGANRRRGWATCPLTINGCVRVLTNPAYPTVEARPVEEDLFRPRFIPGHQTITDVYLLGLAVRRKGMLATFDRSIPLKAVIGANSRDLSRRS